MTEPQLDASLNRAEALIQAGEFGRAIPILREATDAFPHSAAAWKALGVSENKVGDHAAAERDLQQALHLDATDADAWSSLGGVYVALERYDDALKAFEQGIAAGSSTTYALLNYLTMATIVGDVEAALHQHAASLVEGRRLCEAQIAQGVNSPWCYYDLAQILFFERGAPHVPQPLREALRRSSEWQARSARWTYDLLARSPRFAAAAREVLLEFDRHARAFPPVAADPGQLSRT